MEAQQQQDEQQEQRVRAPKRAPERSGLRCWYEGRTLLVTGGAGFMGKVLLEKVLRALPGVRRIYLLLRAKRGAAPARRLQDMLALPVFEGLRREQPAALQKLVVVEGDLLLPGLGLAAGDLQRLLAEVSVVIHGAANLRFEAELAPALAQNVGGTRSVLELAAQMPHLEAFVHLSTAFCHPNLEVVDECTYPSPAPPDDLLRLVDWVGEAGVKTLTPRILGLHPNCYTYTKQVAEALVAEARGRLPVTIVRPSIVTPALSEPLPGWVDSLNGPVGLGVGAGKGVIRSMLCGRDFTAEVVPVDVAANVIIAAAWDAAVHRSHEKETPVYNASTGDVVRVSWGEVLDRGRRLAYEYPFEGVVWYPDGDIRTSPLAHALLVFFFHTVPAYLLDLLLLLALQKPFMVRLQRRINAGLGVLQYFTMRPWKFLNARTMAIEEQMTPEERRIFFIVKRNVDINEYLQNVLLGARQYCMKEPLSSLPRARRHIKMMYAVHVVAKLMFWIFAVYLALALVEPLRTVLDVTSRSLRSNSFFRALAVE